MSEYLKKIKEEKSKNNNPIEDDDLTVEKLKELIGDQTISDVEAKEIIFGINTLVNIIINFQREQKLNENNEEEFNLNQAA